MVTSENPITSILPEDFGAKKSEMQSFRPSLCRGNVNLTNSLCGPLCPLWSTLSCSGSYTTTSFPSPRHGKYPQTTCGPNIPLAITSSSNCFLIGPNFCSTSRRLPSCDPVSTCH